MVSLNIPFIILLVALIISVILLIILIWNELQNVKLEKRFANFSMQSFKTNEPSFFDIIYTSILSIIKVLSRIFNKSSFLDKYSNLFIEKENNDLTKIDFISLKFLLGFIFVFINLVFNLFRINKLNPIIFLIAFLIGFFILDIIAIITKNNKKKRLEDDFLAAIMIMNNSFKAGKNIMQAIYTVKNELDGAMAKEFQKIYMDITYGLSLEVVFERFYERVNLEYAKYIASSLTLLNKTGGDITSVFGNIEKNFFMKKKMMEELKSLTSASVFVFRILLFLPILFSLIIVFINPTYFNPFFNSFLGMFLFLIVIILYILYIVVIKKVLKVKF